MSFESVKTLAETFYYFGASLAAILALYVYYRNRRLEQSRWASSFYDKFYESDHYKRIRDALDGGDQRQVLELVQKEESEFTDYLNFFEHVAIIVKSKQLNKDDVEASFGYYLDCLCKVEAVRRYIANEEKGYEQLDEYLERRRS